MTNDPTNGPRSLAELLTRQPSDAERQHRANDLIGRARLVRAHGWDAYRYAWSTGEVAGVALVLDDADVLSGVAENEAAALGTWAANLWGIAGGEVDGENGYERTRCWLSELRVALG